MYHNYVDNIFFCVNCYADNLKVRLYVYMLVYVCLYVYMLVFVCSYDYMCIFVCRGNLHQYTENILKQMEGLLTLNTPHSNTIVNGIQPNAAGDTQSWLTNEEQMFLYEVASQLIVNSNLSAQVCICIQLLLHFAFSYCEPGESIS